MKMLVLVSWPGGEGAWRSRMRDVIQCLLMHGMHGVLESMGGLYLYWMDGWMDGMCSL